MTEFIIEAAELTPALRALAPLTRNLQKGEPVEGKACEMIYCRFTHEGELLLVTADHLFQTAAAIKLPISGFDGDMCEFAIGREKIKQITNVFKPYKDDPLPVRVTVDRLHTSLGKMEDVITFTELDTLHSPASLSFAGEEYQEIPYRQILKSLGKIAVLALRLSAGPSTQKHMESSRMQQGRIALMQQWQQGMRYTRF